MTKVFPINQTVRTLHALRPQIRVTLQQAARHTLSRTRAWQIRQWTRDIGSDLKFDLDVREIEIELIPERELEITRGISLIRLDNHYAAFSETMHFLSVMTSLNSPHPPRPRNSEQFIALAKRVFKSFFSVIASSRGGVVPPHKLTAAQDNILNAFNDLRPANGVI